MAIECPDCKDISVHATDAYRPFCVLAKTEISRGQFECFCKRYPGYKDCPIRREKFGH